MTRPIAVVGLAFILALISCSYFSGYAPKPGDIVFQDLNSPQAQAVKLATGSQYTHCGIIFEQDNNFVVYEAVGPTRVIPLQDWIRQGVKGHFVARRIDTLLAHLTDESLARMRQVGESHLGKPYDPVFNWSDSQMYCSELVWKIYRDGLGLELAPLRKLGGYQIEHPAVRQKLRERYGDSIPLQEPVIAPADLMASERLKQVYSN
ncbi:MAG: YiiX family permuted papain-like enzyme [Candidatus Zixiibacteriota bacterium]